MFATIERFARLDGLEWLAATCSAMAVIAAVVDLAPAIVAIVTALLSLSA